MKRVVSVIGISIFLLCCISSSDISKAQKIPGKELNKESIEIVETIPIVPSAEKLIEEEVRETRGWDKDCTDNTKKLSYEEAQMLLKIAYSEAGNQGVKGQLKIMETVWNRKESDLFPNTIEEVLSQPGHFDSYTNGSYEKAEPTAETHLALAEFEKNLNHDDNPIGFENVKNGNVLLRFFDFYKVIGDHIFYKLKEQ